MSNPNKQFRPVNPSLGRQPTFGPIPTGQLLPIGFTLSLSYLIFEMLLGWGLTWVALFTFWGSSTWWILTGDRNWKLLNKFIPVPLWYCQFRRYSRLLSEQSYEHLSQRRKDRS